MTVSARGLGGPSAAAGLAAEEVEQFGPLALAQAGERLRVSDAAAGQDLAGLDRADLRQHQEQVAHPRRPRARGRLGEDLRQLDLARRQLPLQLRSRRADFVRLLEGTQALFPRSARNARSCLAARHAAILGAATERCQRPRTSEVELCRVSNKARRSTWRKSPGSSRSSSRRRWSTLPTTSSPAGGPSSSSGCEATKIGHQKSASRTNSQPASRAAFASSEAPKTSGSLPTMT